MNEQSGRLLVGMLKLISADTAMPSISDLRTILNQAVAGKESSLSDDVILRLVRSIRFYYLP